MHQEPCPRRPARVLIVDDSVVARGLFTRWIDAHPAMSVVATAADGLNAVKATARLQPDIIILDLDMPVMDGVTALPELLKVSPDSHVLVASSLTARSARLAMQCLAAGAADVLAKPESNRDLTLSFAFRDELMRKIEGLCAAPLPAEGRDEAVPAASIATVLDVAPRLVVIGASTGGPRALEQVLVDLGPAAADVPIIIVQHMPPVFTASLAERLGTRLGRPVREARHDESPMPGGVYVAPGGCHLRLHRVDGQARMALDDSAPVKFCRPSVDVLFADAAMAYGASTLAVMLTGMGNDGLDGARLLAEAGARIIAQDEASSVVWGMPGAIVRDGLADMVLPMDQIGGAIAARLRRQVAA